MVEFVAIVESFASSQEVARKNHPNVKIVSSVESILNEIDAAFIVTPTSTHYELAKLLLENNKHVFCEKPVCSTVEQAKFLFNLSENKDVIFQVGHSERFHEAWETIASNLNELTPPYYIRINRVASFKGRATDVDVIQDLGIHDLDLVLKLFNKKPLKLVASGIKMRTNNYDHASIRLKLENDCVADIVVSRNHVKEIRDLEIVSQNGLIHVDLFQNKISFAPSTTFNDGTFVKEQNYQKRDHLLLEHSAFYRSIREKSPVVVNILDGMKAVYLVDLSLKSIEEKKELDVKFDF
jgi:predicted dehydrogenase